jgi:hypothetical protein
MVTKENLTQYADLIERTFIGQNIEKFVTEFESIEDIEIMAISACWLNIGTREEGVENAKWAYDLFKDAGSPLQYVLNKGQNWTRYQYLYTRITAKHTLNDWWLLMGKIYKIYSNGSTILNEVLNGIKEKETSDIRDATLEVLFDMFSGVGKMPTTLYYLPNKFVRFVMMMVRPRPIGTGIWSEVSPEVFDSTKTYIPLNSEFVKVIADYDILPSPNMTWAFGSVLRNFFAEIFPDDPARGYFSLLGLINYQPT